MKKAVDCSHELQTLWPNESKWTANVAGMFKPVFQLLQRGEVQHALERAKAIHLENYGPNDPCRIRIVSIQTTITADVFKDCLDI